MRRYLRAYKAPLAHAAYLGSAYYSYATGESNPLDANHQYLAVFVVLGYFLLEVAFES